MPRPTQSVKYQFKNLQINHVHVNHGESLERARRLINLTVQKRRLNGSETLQYTLKDSYFSVDPKDD